MTIEPEHEAPAGQSPGKQRLVRYECVVCHAWFFSDAQGTGLCRCKALPVAHPPGWRVARRDGGPGTAAALRWWDAAFGGKPTIWYCGSCWAMARARAPRLPRRPPWES